MKTIYTRQSLRLQNYDYAQAGMYAVTLVTHHRECLLGDVVNGAMSLNPAGRTTELFWRRLAEKFLHIELDACVIMPNHIHGIILIKSLGPKPCVRPDKNKNKEQVVGQTHGVAPTLGRMMQWFKTMTTNAYIRGVKNDLWPMFDNKLWQRNYYEHVIRDENELLQVRKYIVENPKKWELDFENPAFQEKTNKH